MDKQTYRNKQNKKSDQVNDQVSQIGQRVTGRVLSKQQVKYRNEYNKSALDMFDLKSNLKLTRQLSELEKELKEKRTYGMGFPATFFDYSFFGSFLNMLMNNLGEPTQGGQYAIHTKAYEIKLLKFYYQIFHCHENAWGYLTSGSTEANKMAFLLTRQLYGEKGVVFVSDQTHSFVVDRAKDYFRRHVTIPSQTNGEMKYAVLEERLNRLHDHGEYVPVVVVNIGTTFLGAIDNIKIVSQIIKNSKFEHFYIHCDAALLGNFLPFIDQESPLDFKKYPIDSISVSGHKLPGIPIPSGLFVCRHARIFDDYKETAYLDVKNSTLNCSRSGLAALMWWAFVEHLGKDGFKKVIQHCYKMTEYLLKRFQDISWKAWVNKNSNTVIFESPANTVVEKWVISKVGKWSHIVVMPHFSYSLVDEFIDDIKKQQRKGSQKQRLSEDLLWIKSTQ